jgi:hypothetical protein
MQRLEELKHSSQVDEFQITHFAEKNEYKLSLQLCFIKKDVFTRVTNILNRIMIIILHYRLIFKMALSEFQTQKVFFIQHNSQTKDNLAYSKVLSMFITTSQDLKLKLNMS